MVGILDVKSVLGLIPRDERASIPEEQLYDFIDRGVVIGATDREGDAQYVAVAAAISASIRTSDMASRNAGFLKRFTGKPASAMVAANRIDDHVRDLVMSDEIFWWEITDENLDFH